jgi:transposase InsO family protein
VALKSKLAISSSLQYDGQRWTVKGFMGGQIQLQSQTGHMALMDLATVTGASDYKVLDLQSEVDATDIVSLTDNVPEELLKKAEELLSHLQEMECGYRSGNMAIALPDEPRFEYDPTNTTLRKRMRAKSKEIGISFRTLWELKAAYLRQGIYGLIDQRQMKQGNERVDKRIQQALRWVLADLSDKSNVTRKLVIERIKFRIREQHPGEKIEFPSDRTLYRILEVETKGTGAFGSAKSRRNNANRPKETYRKQEVTRPGEFVLIDSTPLDAFALDPVSFLWIQVQLTIALDLFSRSIVGWRFTPVSTKGVDAALLLYDIIRPKLMQQGWPEQARWPYIGVPESIVIELADEIPEHGIAGVPMLHPETVVIDHGKVFISRAFKDACARLGINLQLARPYTPTDKAQVERVFRTIRENFVERLPGYKGPDIFSRGLNVEDDAFYFIDEIEARFAFWVSTEYQRDPHDGLALPGIPLLDVSPNNVYSEGLARAGFVYVVSSELMYYELLPTEWRTVQHYGVERGSLRYNGDILSDYRNRTSPYRGIHKGKWPFRYDPRDLSRIFFFDLYSEQWHELRWTHDDGAQHPFNEATLSFAKSLLISRGGNIKSIDEVAESLKSLLSRMSTPSEQSRRERKLAAINAMHAQQVRKDQPISRKPIEEPDAEVDLFVDGPIQGRRTTISDDSTVAEKDQFEFVPLRSMDEAMEDDDDELGF